MEKIKLVVMDVDGTLTDGKINMSNTGESFKTFDIKDGYAIRSLLEDENMIPVIITGRTSKIVENRAAELKISELFQGVSDKLGQLNKVIKHNYRGECYGLDNVAFIGDDLNDLPTMIAVKEAGGLVGCPSDAVKKVREVADFISSKSGGNGAVREFIDWILGEL